MTINQKLQELAIQFPGLVELTIDYEGSGDDFSDFWNVLGYDKDEKEYNFEDEKVIEEIVRNLGGAILFNQNHNLFGVNFNDNGCEGVITFDLVNYTVKVDNNHVIRESISDQIYEINTSVALDDE